MTTGVAVGVGGSMRIIDSRLYRWAEIATDLFLLTLLWLVVSLPLVTLCPATTAVFGVFRAWEEGEGAGIVGPFFASFRARLRQSLVVGFGWSLLGVILLFDLLATRRMTGPLAFPLLVAMLGLALCYLLPTVYIYPTLANARTTAFGVVRNAFLLALSQPLLSLLAAFGMIVWGVALYAFPILLPLFGGVVAYGLNALFNRAIRRFPAAAPEEGTPTGPG